MINIAKDFSDTPGARYRNDGPYSGQEFREEFLEKYFVANGVAEKITIDLDGTEGYATSFLEEAFGGLARKYGVSKCLKLLVFISEEDKSIPWEIEKYIKDVDQK